MALTSCGGRGVRQALLLLALAFLAGTDFGARPFARGAEPPAAPLDAFAFQKPWCFLKVAGLTP